MAEELQLSTPNVVQGGKLAHLITQAQAQVLATEGGKAASKPSEKQRFSELMQSRS